MISRSSFATPTVADQLRRVAELIARRSYIVHNSRFAKAKHVEKPAGKRFVNLDNGAPFQGIKELKDCVDLAGRAQRGGVQPVTTARLVSGGVTMRLTRNRDPSASRSYS